ncbi:nicotinamide riboside transporter PnuC [Helicobacter mustelae]|uniref:Nicotinamide riboside transporter PnuC n=1 Tax=Helicobacter mustelae (strain ATCC 43772 / CCUG 25715 / CIP 103759 / LMG 18044 / NCTC 12198 / R85-136P) TaxID=679897 RepID=D3UJ27_HELM1|nr:nicotinamide riboside transporter PnuC [Helicobacter mustelae]CBG40502.1 putative Nicotinamide mononucleotide transporter, PnuC [Helicobacter mustelae 12198]SQH72001.1 nicotinamide mononucleotide transporter, PnuC [Helicobacter mustelae]STP13144.1 nicotinamide mononucleotide transporter, PnuC [Helicobacter mustelae]
MRNFLRYQFANLSASFWGVLFLCCACVLVFGIYSQDHVLNLIGAILGVLFAFFAGAGKPICFIFGIFYSVLMIFITFEAKLYIELWLNLFYLPINVIALTLWQKNLNDEKKRVRVHKLTPTALLLVLVGIAILSIALWQIGVAFHAEFALLNSITTVLQIVAFILQTQRYAQHYWLVTLANLIMVYIWLKISLGDFKFIFQFLNSLVFLGIGIYYALQWYKIASEKES